MEGEGHTYRRGGGGGGFVAPSITIHTETGDSSGQLHAFIPSL